jgi:osmoprotectant transport system permease protein
MMIVGEGRSLFFQAWSWLADPAHWSGPSGIRARLLQHITYSGLGILLACLVAIPVALAIGHTRRGEFVAVSVANLGRAIPSFAILSIVYQLMLSYEPTQKIAFGSGPTVVAMFLLAIPPILTNTSVGVQQVDPDTVEAAKGMGLTGRQILRRLEVPLAAPLILTGVRTATVQVIATATLAALIGGGGLGRFIVDGFAQQDYPMLVGGAILVAALAIAAEIVFGGLARVVAPTTSSARSRRPAQEIPSPV